MLRRSFASFLWCKQHVGAKAQMHTMQPTPENSMFAINVCIHYKRPYVACSCQYALHAAWLDLRTGEVVISRAMGALPVDKHCNVSCWID